MSEESLVISAAGRKREDLTARSGCSGLILLLLAGAAVDSLLVALAVFLYRWAFGP